MRTAAVALATMVVTAIASTPAPPDPKKLLPKYTIDLDSPPEKRWAKVIADHTKVLKVLIPVVKAGFNKKTMAALIPAIKKGLDKGYAQEIQAMASLLNTTYDDMIMWNSYYELSEAHGMNKRACTSIVAQGTDGTMYSGHNFDYPTEFAPTLIDAFFTKGGKVVYEGSVVAGWVGFVAGLVPGKWSVALDARDHYKASVSQAVKAAEAGAYTFVGLARKAMDASDSTFESAVKFYKETPLITGGYFIVGGSQVGQGAVVTTNSSAVNNDVWNMKDAEGWFILETNNDHWLPDTEGRRIAGVKNMKAIGAKNISLLGIWNVLSTSPNYRSATVTTHIVDIAAGKMSSYIRNTIAAPTLIV